MLKLLLIVILAILIIASVLKFEVALFRFLFVISILGIALVLVYL